MKTYKFITDFLAKNNIEYSKHGGKYYIGRCAVGEDNFYDYGEAEKLLTFYKGYEWLANDPHIVIVDCCDCCACAG